jgi:hypothetical protein
MEEIITPPTKPTPEEDKRLTFDVYIKHIEMLDKIKEWYRSPTIAHTMRLMIEDVHKSIENNTYMKGGYDKTD